MQLRRLRSEHRPDGASDHPATAGFRTGFTSGCRRCAPLGYRTQPVCCYATDLRGYCDTFAALTGFLLAAPLSLVAGIALGNVLLPGLIKRDFAQHVAKLTGAYSLTMGAAAALGSAIVVPLALNGFGWRGALMVLMAFPLLALIIWLPQCRQMANASLSSSARSAFPRDLALQPRPAGDAVSGDQFAYLLRHHRLAARHFDHPWLQRGAGRFAAWFTAAGDRRAGIIDSSRPEQI